MRRNIAKINVMMLATLEALYLHKTTVLAAEKLGLAQPSVSWYLKQLRELTGDELFIRGAAGLEPTEFCARYYHQAREILNALDLLAGNKNKTFDPENETAEFSVAIPFFKARMLLEGLSVRLMKKFPSIQTDLLYLEETEALTHLESGLLDIYIGIVSEKLPKHFSAERALESEFIVLCSDKCKFFKKRSISKQDFIDTPHVKVAAGFEPSILDVTLRQHGLMQKKLISVPDIGSEIILLRETGCLLIVDRNDAEIMMAGNDFRILKTDFELPQLMLYAVWHARRKNDPAHSWLRDYLQKLCRDYTAGRRPDPARFRA